LLITCPAWRHQPAQALVNDVPVIGVASNLDQYLNMSYVEQCGAGRLLRAGRLSAAGLRELAAEILSHEHYRTAAARVGAQMRAYDAPARLQLTVDEILAR
jgi:UDP:flavonoid glycosyltransferase YjiC (YdhE family)